MELIATMKQTRRRSQSASRTPGAGGSPVVRGVTLGSTLRPPRPSRPGTGGGRLGRAVRAASNSAGPQKSVESATRPASRSTSPPASRPASRPELGRWENEGGRTTPLAPVSHSNKRQKNVAQPKRKSKQSASSATLAKRASPPDHGRQMRAETASKQSRIKRTGVDSRVLGHVSARGKRNQARRDSKNS
jgi:hypothetical protein